MMKTLSLKLVNSAIVSCRYLIMFSQEAKTVVMMTYNQDMFYTLRNKLPLYLDDLGTWGIKLLTMWVGVQMIPGQSDAKKLI